MANEGNALMTASWDKEKYPVWAKNTRKTKQTNRVSNRADEYLFSKLSQIDIKIEFSYFDNV